MSDPTNVQTALQTFCSTELGTMNTVGVAVGQIRGELGFSIILSADSSEFQTWYSDQAGLYEGIPISWRLDG
jgi:hypothetical protein